SFSFQLSTTLLGGEWELSQRRARGSLNPHSPCLELAAKAELLDQGAIALEVVLLEIRQEAAAPADELQQPAAGIVVVLVRAQMLGQLVDALREHCDLHLRRAGVGLTAAVLLDDLQLCFLREGHEPPLLSSPEPPPARREAFAARQPGLGRRIG